MDEQGDNQENTKDKYDNQNKIPVHQHGHRQHEAQGCKYKSNAGVSLSNIESVQIYHQDGSQTTKESHQLNKQRNGQQNLGGQRWGAYLEAKESGGGLGSDHNDDLR